VFSELERKIAMRRFFKIAGVVLAVIVALAVVAVQAGQYAFARMVDGNVRDMFAAGQVSEPSVLTDADIADLPEPVQRWLRYSGTVGRERPATVRLKQEGEIRLGPDANWMPFTAEQYYTTDPPAFIWHADVKMMPLVSFAGQDRYADGRGHMDIRVLSLVQVVDETGPEMDQGTLVRYLNETMWFPAGAVSPYITWEPVDDNSAIATMRYQGVEASATFYFDDEGRLTNMVADRYYSEGDGSFGFYPWSTPVDEYGEFDGMRLPVQGEAFWHTPDRDFSYIRLRIVDIEYNLPELY
jgi:hypothetical protein